MKIRCGSHQQNRSIVRPGLSLMAAKVALTAEEFRENSQRSIALFNTEKLSTNSTHVLKSAYCNSVHFCRCNLHGACGGKAAPRWQISASAAGCNLHGACGGKGGAEGVNGMERRCCNLHGACGGKVTWRALTRRTTSRCNLHGACGGKVCWKRRLWKCCSLQSARSVWRQRLCARVYALRSSVAICTERVEAKKCRNPGDSRYALLQSARSVWRQRLISGVWSTNPLIVAICTERVEAKIEDVSLNLVTRCCNLHGACGGKAQPRRGGAVLCALQSARSVWRQSR